MLFNILKQKENWNIYPFQWMYGGENDTGLNSQNQDEVILYFVKLILCSVTLPCG